MQRTYKGSCLCGQVTFEAGGFSRQVANCHCTMCRKFHGSAFGTLVAASYFNWISGQSLLSDYVAPNGTIRTFCKECGSSLGFRVKGQSIDQLGIAIATFDEELPVKIDAHIYTNYKASWHDISDDLPKHGEGRSNNT